MDVHFMIDVFTSKADVLKYLSNKLIHSKIEKLFDFTISEWNNNDQKILQEITKKFNSTIIIRSSALGEDSMTSSKAGEFLSVMNVNPECKNEVNLENYPNLAVEQVIECDVCGIWSPGHSCKNHKCSSKN